MEFSFIIVMDEKGNEMAAGIMNIETTAAVDMKLSKKGTLHREIEVFKPVVSGWRTESARGIPFDR